MKTKEMTEQQRLGISDETMHSMRLFFLKHSVPKLIEKKRREDEQNTKNDIQSK